MPLSEQEQRLLDEMERHLMHNDADVVHASREGRAISYRNIVYGALAVLIGLGALVAGVAVPLAIVGVIGFIVMLGGVVLAVTPVRAAGSSRHESSASSQKASSSSRASFMDRMNDRWDKRQDGH